MQDSCEAIAQGDTVKLYVDNNLNLNSCIG